MCLPELRILKHQRYLVKTKDLLLDYDEKCVLWSEVNDKCGPKWECSEVGEQRGNLAELVF